MTVVSSEKVILLEKNKHGSITELPDNQEEQSNMKQLEGRSYLYATYTLTGQQKQKWCSIKLRGFFLCRLMENKMKILHIISQLMGSLKVWLKKTNHFN